MKPCPEYLSEIPDDARVCRYCTERIEGQRCPACRAMCPGEATKCRWCRHEFEPVGRLVELEPFDLKAARLPTFLFRHRLLPQELHFSTNTFW